MRERLALSLGWLIVLFATLVPGAQQVKEARSVQNAVIAARPLILERTEGELCTRRIPASNLPMSFPASQFLLKFSPKNNSSQHLVLGTEQVPPGARIRAHKHLEQDEILLIQTGTANVELGGQRRDVHAGGLVFIPANTRIALLNVGSEPVSLVFVFSAPGFEDYMRCVSVPSGRPAPPITREELKSCAHDGHVVYEDLWRSDISPVGA